jgi:hypothetical protein
MGICVSLLLALSVLTACGGGSSSGKPTPAKVVTSISITPETQTLFLNSSQQFDAVSVYSDGSVQDITTTAQWQSSAPNDATVSSAGIVTAVAAGNVTISVASGSVSSSADVTVSPSNTGVTMIDDLTDSRLMQYWPGDGSVVTYSGTRNSDGTFAAINGAGITEPPAANQPNKAFTFDSQGRESTATFSDGTLIGFNWTANPTMVITPPPPNQAAVVIVPLTTSSDAVVRNGKEHASVRASSEPSTSQASSAASSAPEVLVNVTTNLGAGAQPEDNALVDVGIYYAFGSGSVGSQMPPIPAMETPLGSGRYTVTLPSGPSDVSPSVLQSSASKALAEICKVPLSAAVDCGPEALVCAAAISALALACKAQNAAQLTYSTANFLNKLLPPYVTAEASPNGCGYHEDATPVAGSNYVFNLADQCTPTAVSVNPNPATTSAGGTVPLGATAYGPPYNGSPTQIRSSALAWSWAVGSGVPSYLQDSYLQITPQGTDTPEGWAGGKFGVAVADVTGQNPTPTGSPDTVTAVEANSDQNGTSSVTVGGGYYIYTYFLSDTTTGYTLTWTTVPIAAVTGPTILSATEISAYTATGVLSGTTISTVELDGGPEGPGSQYTVLTDGQIYYLPDGVTLADYSTPGTYVFTTTSGNNYYDSLIVAVSTP